MWRQGYNKSDQIMARALMTPDELRRLDNDMCIIFEKGIKPIKAQKYYYFKYNTGRLVQQYAVDHNDREDVARGEWRKYNPYNPYVEKKDGEKEQNTSIESLDDLFEETPEELKETTQQTATVTTDAKNQEESYDIQKELEAKFDELFGAFDDDN